MEKILLLLHTESDGSLSKSTLESVTAAAALAADLSTDLFVGIVGSDCQSAANQIAGCGAKKILTVQGPEFSSSRYASDAAAATALCQKVEPTLIVATSDSRWSRCLPGVAYRVSGRIDTHLTRYSVENGEVFVSRWYYRQRMESIQTRSHRPWFMLFEPGNYESYKGSAGTATVEQLTVTVSSATRVDGFVAPPADEQTIRPEAELLFVAGAGWTKKQADGQTHLKDAEDLILGFLRKSNASLGSSKSLVDLKGEGQDVLKFMSHLNQVGQTGATPRHPKGLSTCCHGEEPHVVGWRFINERRAINLDPNCGWAQGKADVLYVADAFAVVRKLIEMM